VNTDGVDALDLKASTLELVDDEAKRSGSVSTGEDVLVHEQTPDKVLVLPALPETGDLEEEDTIIVKHIVNLLQEGMEVTDTNVLGHLKAGDLVVTTLGNGDIAVVHAQNLALILGDASVAQSIIAPLCLVATKSDTGNLSAVVDAGEAGKSAPAAANIEHLLILLEVDLLANDSHLVVLELLKGFLLLNVRDDARGVDHARAEEPAIEVIAAVIVVAHLLLICNWGYLVREQAL